MSDSLLKNNHYDGRINFGYANLAAAIIAEARAANEKWFFETEWYELLRDLVETANELRDKGTNKIKSSRERYIYTLN